MRKGAVKRKTKETDIAVEIDLDVGLLGLPLHRARAHENPSNSRAF